MAASVRVFANCDESQLDAFVSVDSLVCGRAMGGTRMTPDVTQDEVAGLARKMTQKLALARIPIGGAKAGIRSSLPPGQDRDEQLATYGRLVAPLLHGGVYLGTDQGITHRDRELFFGAAGFDVCRHAGVRVPCSWSDLWSRCRDVTGFGVCVGVRAAAELLARSGRPARVAIQGFGAVGRPIAAMLERHGHRVVAIADRWGTLANLQGLSVEELIARTDASGTIDRSGLPVGVKRDGDDAWLETDADLLVLAAGGDAVNQGNAGRVRASVVVEAGNLACSEAAHRLLARRGVAVLPDIVVNCGGASVTGLVLSGANPPELDVDGLVAWLHDRVASTIRANVTAVIERAERGRPLAEAAERLAEERLAEIRSTSEELVASR